jgi:hypothetical protein
MRTTGLPRRRSRPASEDDRKTYSYCLTFRNGYIEAVLLCIRALPQNGQKFVQEALVLPAGSLSTGPGHKGLQQLSQSAFSIRVNLRDLHFQKNPLRHLA